MKRLEGRLCIINGADTEVGMAIARVFRDEGAEPVLAGYDRNRLETLAGELNVFQFTYSADSGGPAQQFEGLLNRLREQSESPCTLINCILNGNFIPDSTWDLRMSGEVENICRSAFTLLKDSDSPSIVNIYYSENTRAFRENRSILAGGLSALTRSLALEFAPHEVRVNGLSLGFFKTSAYRQERALREPEYEKKILRHIPMGRLGRPGEVANSALFLAGKDSSYVTGVNIQIDGGYSVF